MNNEILLNNVRLSYPSLYTVNAKFPDPRTGECKYEATFLIDKDTPEGKEAKKAISKRTSKLFNEHIRMKLKNFCKNV